MADTILIVNAGSSSIKFSVYDVGGTPSDLSLSLKGQVGAIGTHPRLRAHDADGLLLVDQTFTVPEIPDVGVAMERVAAWLRERFAGVVPAAVADRFAIPEGLYREGVRRYGFHGLSCEYIARALPGLAPEIAEGAVVVAHLGSGASMCAIKGGRSVDSTMAFTALDGLPMGTRCGQIDPGVLLYLVSEKGYGAKELEHLLYHEAGLRGLSGISNDVRDLLASEDPRARICARAAWLGLRLDEAANRAGGPRISTPGSRVSAWVIPTDEERMIAEHTLTVWREQQAVPRVA